ncbi:hypothetical protein ABEV34_04465 [Methylorubrum rhodesianum]|uniref:hypothetical protein n=1 Tax=Methylorubrum rhodesianum TaxID=29427 RepID=UPI003D27F011
METTSSVVQAKSAAESVLLPPSEGGRSTGENDHDGTTRFTAGNTERKTGLESGRAGATGTLVAESKAGLPTAAASNTPCPGDRTFVGQPKPRDPDEIGLGSVVLAHEGPDEGWWEAEVIGINGRVFSLRWRDYPTQPTILRKATELALLPPGEA